MTNAEKRKKEHLHSILHIPYPIVHTEPPTINQSSIPGFARLILRAKNRSPVAMMAIVGITTLAMICLIAIALAPSAGTFPPLLGEAVIAIKRGMLSIK